jgi:hypothetical protein
MTRKELISASKPGKNGRRTPRIVRAVCLMVLALCCVNATPSQDQAMLYFFNTSGWTVFQGKLTLLDNDKKIGGADREQYVALPIAPGHHVLRLKGETSTVRSKKHEVDLDAMPGVTYYVAGGYHPQVVGQLSTWTFAEISKDEAEKLLAEMKPQAKK